MNRFSVVIILVCLSVGLSVSNSLPRFLVNTHEDDTKYGDNELYNDKDFLLEITLEEQRTFPFNTADDPLTCHHNADFSEEICTAEKAKKYQRYFKN